MDYITQFREYMANRTAGRALVSMLSGGMAVAPTGVGMLNPQIVIAEEHKINPEVREFVELLIQNPDGVKETRIYEGEWQPNKKAIAHNKRYFKSVQIPGHPDIHTFYEDADSTEPKKRGADGKIDPNDRLYIATDALPGGLKYILDQGLNGIGQNEKYEDDRNFNDQIGYLEHAWDAKKFTSEEKREANDRYMGLVRLIIKALATR